MSKSVLLCNTAQLYVFKQNFLIKAMVSEQFFFSKPDLKATDPCLIKMVFCTLVNKLMNTESTTITCFYNYYNKKLIYYNFILFLSINIISL